MNSERPVGDLESTIEAQTSVKVPPRSMEMRILRCGIGTTVMVVGSGGLSQPSDAFISRHLARVQTTAHLPAGLVPTLAIRARYALPCWMTSRPIEHLQGQTSRERGMECWSEKGRRSPSGFQFLLFSIMRRLLGNMRQETKKRPSGGG